MTRQTDGKNCDAPCNDARTGLIARDAGCIRASLGKKWRDGAYLRPPSRCWENTKERYAMGKPVADNLI
eukprot:10725194-Lingulodinium_polyedra.AAC.1